MKSINIYPRRFSIVAAASLFILAAFTPSILADAPTEKQIYTPDGVRASVKMIGPITQPTDLQILCVLKHDPAGDKYLEAMKDFNDKLGGLISSLRDRGEFAGDLGETLVFTPPPDSIAAKRVLLIGVGEEQKLSLDAFRLVGRIAAREAVRMNAVHVSFAPTLRDQGSKRIDVGDGDAAVTEQFLLAYDTETHLQAQGLAPPALIQEFTIEAGPKFFAAAVEKVTFAAASAAQQIPLRSTSAFISAGK